MKVAAIVVALSGAMTFHAQAQTTWNMPTNYADSQFQTKNNRWFADEITKRSEGRLKITVHSNASLYKMAEILRAVQSGQVQIGEVLLSSYANEDPIFALDGLPFLAVGRDAAMKLYQAQKPALEEKLAKRGMRLLYSVIWPGQGIYTRKPIHSLDDLKGVKFRAYSPITARLAALVNAQPVVVPLPEVSQAFLTGMVEAMIVSSATIDTKPWEYSKFYYTTDAMLPRNIVFVNEREFRRLPQDLQKIILDTARDAELRGWNLMEQSDRENMDIMKKNGMEVVAPSPQLTKSFERIGEVLLNEWLATAGDEGRAIVKAFRNR